MARARSPSAHAVTSSADSSPIFLRRRLRSASSRPRIARLLSRGLRRCLGHPGGDRRVERAQRIRRERRHAEAGARARVTRGARRADAREDRIAVAIRQQRDDLLHVPARRALVPQTARARAIVHLARGERSLQRLAIRVRDHQHGPAVGVLRHDRDEATPLGEVQRVEIEHVRVTSECWSAPRGRARRRRATGSSRWRFRRKRSVCQASR